MTNRVTVYILSLVLGLCLSPLLAYRRDHRFLRTQASVPSLAYSSLIAQYSNVPSKNFGLIVDHPNSDGSTTKQVVLNNNICLPLVGFGTWQLGNDTTVKRAISTAINTGYRLIDTAYIYGNENAIGDTLQEMFASGKVTRQDMFITTKVWNTFQSKPRVLQSIRDSLKKLKLNYLDLVLLHYPTGFKEGLDNYPKFSNGSIIPRTWKQDSYLESWEAMEEAVQLGLTRSIGVSNFNQAQMQKLLHKSTIKPVLNQVESNPNLKQDKLRSFLLGHQVLMQAYAPIRRADKDLLQHPTLASIGKQHNKTTAQIALRWQLDRLVPIVVKSSNPGRMAANIDLFDFALDASQVNQINLMEEKPRIYNIPGIENHPDYPFQQED